MHTPFLAWFSYTAPFAWHWAGYGGVRVFILWLVHEVLWRVMGTVGSEVVSSFILFVANAGAALSLVVAWVRLGRPSNGLKTE